MVVTSEEKALLDYLTEYFDRLMPTGAPVEPSLDILVKALAGVLVCEMCARGMGEAAVPAVVGPYQQLLTTWTREALEYARRVPGGPGC